MKTNIRFSIWNTAYVALGLMLVIHSKVFADTAQELPETQHIYTDVIFQIVDTQFRFKPVSLTNLFEGSCWVTSVGGEQVVVTAAHNLAITPHFKPTKVGPYDLDPDKYNHSILKSMESFPVVGLLTREIKDVGLVGDDMDCVLLRPTKKEMVLASRCIPLASVPVKLGDSVSVSGYPGTAMELTDNTLFVSAFSLGGRFIALNKPLKPGYSGGVLLNAKKEAVGLIVTTTGQQAMALLVNESILKQVRWQPLSAVKLQKF